MPARRTPLYSIFTTLGARMIDRPGFFVPEVFSDPKSEHVAVRETAGLFDIFGQFMIEIGGNSAEALLQRLTVADISKLEPGRVVYCTMLNAQGGIIDDVTVFKVDQRTFWVVPAPSRSFVVEAYLKGEAGADGPSIALLGYRYTTLSLQGPNSRAILAELTDLDVVSIPYFGFSVGNIAGAPDVILSRTGFTGELGYELFVPTEHVENTYLRLLALGGKHGLLPCGLMAMGNLRLEKKYLIYGRDIDDKTTPVEAGLGWTIRLQKPDFVGRAVVERQLKEGTQRKLVLISMGQEERAPIPGQTLVAEGRKIGHVTTAGTGYTVGRTLAIGYLETAFAEEGMTVGLADAPDHKEGKPVTVHTSAVYDRENKRVKA